jgi:hypothetical protein
MGEELLRYHTPQSMPRWIVRYASLDQFVAVLTPTPTATGVIMMTYPSDSAASDQGYVMWVSSRLVYIRHGTDVSKVAHILSIVRDSVLCQAILLKDENSHRMNTLAVGP